MTEEQTPEKPTPEEQAQPVPPVAPERIEPMPENPGLVTTFETLLKNPVALMNSLLGGGGGSTFIVRNLVITTVACLVVFGF
ncbi:MAG: hypothetical protein GY953_56955, partial [bacterium]|nr:hypothetical protein [bacterium]